MGLHGGLTGLALFFFYYSRFVSNEKYENLAYEILKMILSKIDIVTTETNYADGLAGIGSCIDFLSEEKFIEIESEDFFEDVDNSIYQRIIKSPVLDYSFQTGLVGLCNYFILCQGNKCNEIVKITLDQLGSGFAIPNYSKHPVEIIFLMPSEILKDIKLFLRKIEKMNIHREQVALLKLYIKNFEKTKFVLQSNCFEYYKMQYLRETIGFKNRLISENKLDDCVTHLSDKTIQGLTLMYLERPVLPNIWKIL